MKNEKDSFYQGILCGVLGSLVIALILGGFFLYPLVKSSEGITGHKVLSGETQKKLKEAMNLVDQYYLNEVDEDTLSDGLFKGLAYGLEDPYAAYYTEEELEVVKEENAGEYKGIGVVITEDSKTGICRIVQCYEGFPAEQAGVREDDIIYQIEGESVLSSGMNEVINRIRACNDSVSLTVLRGDEQEEIKMDIPLTDIQVPTVTSEMLEDQIGYLQITEFDTISPDQFQAALESLQSQGMERLVIDLRDNTGGYLVAVCKMLDQILPEGLSVYTEDKNGSRQEYTSDEEHQLNLPLVLLVNGHSASASEIFAGAIKDYELGTLIGEQTYGKGIVQNTFLLSDGSALKMTIENYYTPKGNSIQGVGIAPDIEVELAEDAKKGDVSTDNQLQKAIEVLKENNE